MEDRKREKVKDALVITGTAVSCLGGLSTIAINVYQISNLRREKELIEKQKEAAKLAYENELKNKQLIEEEILMQCERLRKLGMTQKEIIEALKN